jgi:hypothetical protein
MAGAAKGDSNIGKVEFDCPAAARQVRRAIGQILLIFKIVQEHFGSPIGAAASDDYA